MDPIVRRSSLKYAPDGDVIFDALGALVEGSYADVDLDVVYSRLLGPELGAGSYKSVHTIRGNDNYVLIVNKQKGSDGLRHLLGQASDLQFMSDAGVPALTYLKVGTVGEDMVPVALSRKLAGSNRGGAAAGIADLWTKKTVEDMVEILACLRKSRAKFSDFQVLIDRDGSLLVNDPYHDFCLVEEIDCPSKRIDKLSSVVEEVARAWANREGGTRDDRKREILEMAKKK